MNSLIPGFIVAASLVVLMASLIDNDVESTYIAIPPDAPRYLQISDHTDQIPLTTNATKITFDQLNEQDGIGFNMTNHEDIIIEDTGEYIIFAQPQYEKTSGGTTEHIDFWLRVNDVDVPSSNIRATIKSNSETDVISSAVIMSLDSGDIVNIIMAVESTGKGMGIYHTEPVGEPDIPSIILGMHHLD